MGIGFAIFTTVVKCQPQKMKAFHANIPFRATKFVAMATSLDRSSPNF